MRLCGVDRPEAFITSDCMYGNRSPLGDQKGCEMHGIKGSDVAAPLTVWLSRAVDMLYNGTVMLCCSLKMLDLRTWMWKVTYPSLRYTIRF